MPRGDDGPFRVPISRYTLPDGARCRKDTPGAIKHTTLSQTWYASVEGKRISLGTADLGTAWERLRTLRRQAVLGIDPRQLTEANTPLAEHLTAYLQLSADQGNSPRYVRLIRRRLTLLFAAAQWRTATDITDESFSRGLARVAAELGLAPSTRNHYLGYARSFLEWLGRRLGRHLLRERHKRINEDVDRRHPRRALTSEEVEKLFASLDGGEVHTTRRSTRGEYPVRHHMTSRRRALCYRLAMATGLRSAEIRSLTWDSFDLDEGTVTVAAAYSKRRREDVQYLPTWLVLRLREWAGEGGELWGDMAGAWKMIRKDLEAAGVPYRTREGFADFHSLRVWYCTQMANQPGISVKTLQEVCRHSTPTLTLQVYARVQIADVREAVEALSEPGVVAPRLRENESNPTPRDTPGHTRSQVNDTA